MVDTSQTRLEAQAEVPARPSPDALPWWPGLVAKATRPSIYYSLFALAVILLWAVYYGRWPGTASFNAPVNYLDGGDVLLVLGVARGFAEFPPPWNLHVERLNAPFGADWNDYPHTEKLIFYPWGLLQRLISVGAASNVFVIIAHLGSGLAFTWCARRLGRSPLVAYVGGLLFAFCPFIVGRALGHVNVSIVWHIPLLLYLTVRLASKSELPSRNVRIGAYAVVVATSFMNPYYPPLAMQLLALGTLAAFLRGHRAMSRLGVELVVLSAASFVGGQFNVYLRSWRAGPNAMFTGRSLEAIRLWALRLPDLFMPPNHPVLAWQTFARAHYFDAGNPVSENSFAFLGFVCCVLFVGLAAFALVRGLQNRTREVPWQAWVTGYVLMFSISGGLDYLVGALGMTWLRAVNRYSIVIQCGVLFWGCDIADRLTLPLARYGALATATTLSLLEMFGLRSPEHAEQLAHVSAKIASDGRFGRTLEKQLPKGAAVFELPVMPFPESPEILRMGDYEHFRPYLFSDNLRFSYGTHKGRPRETWQLYVEQLAPAEMATYLGAHGFDALLLNRRGLPNEGKELESALQTLALKRVAESADHEMVVYKLDKTGTRLPDEETLVALGAAFPWGWEHDATSRWAWSDGQGTLKLVAAPKSGFKYKVTFRLESPVRRLVDPAVGDTITAHLELFPGVIQTVEFIWPDAHQTTLTLRTNLPAQSPGNGDPRRFSYRIIDPVIEPVAANNPHNLHPQ